MSFIKSLIRSFGYAMCGFGAAIKRERNLRIHIVAIIYISFFAVLYGIGKTEWAILIVTMGGVVSAELMNTAVEENTDMKSSKINRHAKIAKDTAAASVLVKAVVSMIVAVMIFGDIGRILYVLGIIISMPYILLFALSLIAAYLFVSGFKKHRKDNSKNKKEIN